MNSVDETPASALPPPQANGRGTIELGPRFRTFTAHRGWVKRSRKDRRGARRTGRDRRRTTFQKLRHSFYCGLFLVKPHAAEIDPGARRPIPAHIPDPGARVDVLLSLHDNARESIHQWENRIFQAFLLSEGALLSAVAFFLDHPNLRSSSHFFATAVGVFGAAALAYLYLAARAHANNGVLLVKIEAALGLCERGVYVRGSPFVGYSGFWVEDWRTVTLLVIHALVVGFAIYVIQAVH